ncbi:MAG: ABC-ATPase domain-containing protein [Candidatus Eisenbacteria bacterium]|nr:ABC-ATPase domain-containing protein [Candidatus Eisenbacteria bacterium]
MRTQDRETLRDLLRRIDGRGYKAYKDIRGRYAFPGFELSIDHVQGDPFAAPSRLRVFVPMARAAFPESTRRNRSRAIALAGVLARAFARAARGAAERRGSGKSGLIEIDRPGQEVLERTAVIVGGDRVEARFVVGLPAAGRRVLGRQAEAMLLGDLPEIVDASLLYAALDAEAIDRAVRTNEDADHLRGALAERGLIAFVADGAVLPRRSGVDDRPLVEGAVPFRSPESLRVSVGLPNAGAVTGMGIPRGVTLIVGGGFHGKSTLLHALERGVYNHLPGDGRERVVADGRAMKIRAEDGRRVAGADISPFIGELPYGRRTDDFTTDNASGSTSQAANILEALEAGASVLLIDEDTAATNFMIRDHRMQELIAKEKEPITPFVDKVRQLFEERGVSSVIVAGGSGDYFDAADTVIAMEAYLPRDATADARAIAERHRAERRPEGGDRFGDVAERIPSRASVDPSRGRREMSVKIRGLRTIQFGEETVDLSAVSQIVDPSQTRAIAEAILYARERYMDGRRTVKEILDAVEEDLAREGLALLSPRPAGDHAAFRSLELAAALNRLRSLEVRRRG